MRIVLFFPFSAETSFISAPPPPLHIPDLSLPLPSLFPSFLPVQVLGFFSALLGFGQKHKKGVFGSGRAAHKGHLFVWGRGQEARPARVTAAPSRKRQCSAPPLAMGEMQGALARARLESLLRPRHKKRAEAQKRSESFLLTGLGKPGRAGAGHCPPRRVAPASGARCRRGCRGRRDGDGGRLAPR